MTPDLDDLIRRVEKTGLGSWRLDEDIGAALGWTREPGQPWPLRVSPDGRTKLSRLPEWSTNLDAAIGTIPTLLYWLIGKGKTRPDEPIYGCTIFRPGENEPMAQAEHATSLPLCIVAAALKARRDG